MSLWQLLNVLSIKLGKGFHMLCMLMYVVLGPFLITSGEIIASSHDLTARCSWGREIPLFQGILGQSGWGKNTHSSHIARLWSVQAACILERANFLEIKECSRLTNFSHGCVSKHLSKSKLQKVMNQCDLQVCLRVWSLGREAEGSIFFRSLATESMPSIAMHENIAFPTPASSILSTCCLDCRNVLNFNALKVMRFGVCTIGTLGWRNSLILDRK